MHFQPMLAVGGVAGQLLSAVLAAEQAVLSAPHGSGGLLFPLVGAIPQLSGIGLEIYPDMFSLFIHFLLFIRDENGKMNIAGCKGNREKGQKG